MAALQLGRLFHTGELRAGLGEPLHNLMAHLRMAQLAAAEPNRNLHLVPVLQETQGVFHLRVEVADIRIESQTHFLHFHDVLILPGFLFPFGLLKPILAVVHDPAYRRLGGRGNLHQVEILLIGQSLGFPRGHDSQLFPIVADEAHLTVTDLLVDLQFLSCYW